jgi:hypothetical protein
LTHPASRGRNLSRRDDRGYLILRVVIDPVGENEVLVPERFLQVQRTQLAGGTATPEFVERMVRLIRDFRKRERGLL